MLPYKVQRNVFAIILLTFNLNTTKENVICPALTVLAIVFKFWILAKHAELATQSFSILETL